MSAGPAPSGSFSLFPKDSARPPSRNQSQNYSRPRTATPQASAQEPSSATDSPSRDSPSRARQGPLGRKQSVRDGKKPASNNPYAEAMSESFSPSDSTAGPSIIQRPEPVVQAPERCDTAFSEAQTLVRNNSNKSRSSIAKRPLSEMPEPSGQMRSIFPEYDPAIPLDRQDYYPSQDQTSPSHIPPGAISRHLYSPVEERSESRAQQVVSPVRSPMSGSSQPARRWPPRSQDKPTVPPTSTTEELRGFWKVANGWKAAPSEGRVYCLKMTSEKDAPIYTLSSATQSFYSIRLDPTSASAYVTMSRHDPNKPFKGPANPAPSSSAASVNGKSDSSKGWQECITTTLEEESRKHPPNDGLVALLYPQAAAKMALDKPEDMAAVMTAERECARLVWDEDTSNYFLSHPALAVPFCVTVERNPAWSRTEYTLEHVESPQHIARLTRDGTGLGWLEVDTGIAAKIDAVYIVDVAVAALMLVAHSDDQFTNVETFEPPPMIFGAPPGSVTSKHDKRSSRMSSRQAERKEKKAANKRSKTRMEEFELDLESQHSDLAKLDVKDKDMDKLPGVARIIIKTLSVTFKCFIWMATILFKALTWMIASVARCLTSEKL